MNSNYLFRQNFNTNLKHIKTSMTALPVVQLSPAQPAVQEVHQPSVCRHVAGLQLGEQTWEQFLPKYPFLQTRSQKKQ